MTDISNYSLYDLEAGAFVPFGRDEILAYFNKLHTDANYRHTVVRRKLLSPLLDDRDDALAVIDIEKDTTLTPDLRRAIEAEKNDELKEDMQDILREILESAGDD